MEHETNEVGAVRSKLYPKGENFDIRLDLVFSNEVGLRRLAETYAEGNAKGYPIDNWKKGFKESVYICHALEHMRLHQMGDKTEDHLAHAAWNILALCWVQEQRPDLLDLTGPKPTT